MLRRDIHSNKETVQNASYDLDQSIALAKRDKDKLLCLIIGYGSKGTAHKIHTAVIKRLEEYLNANRIKGYILGSQLDIFNPDYQNFPARDKIPDDDKRQRNPGAVYVAV